MGLEGPQQLNGTGGLPLVFGTQQEVSGVYVGEGEAPVPKKVAENIWRWDFVKMSELLPEFWGLAGEECTLRRTRVVADIFTWVQNFMHTYVSVQSGQYPEMVPELMAYMAMIVRASQGFKDLAWVRCDVGFRRQAALTKNRRWSQINSTLHSIALR